MSDIECLIVIAITLVAGVVIGTLWAGYLMIGREPTTNAKRTTDHGPRTTDQHAVD